jgi:hypothetical protein
MKDSGFSWGIVAAGALAGAIVAAAINAPWFRSNPKQAQEQRLQNDARLAADDDYAGAFACHTLDGGCLHFACNSKASCDYMMTLQKKCAAPALKPDKDVLESAIVSGNSCGSIRQETRVPESK